MLQDRDSRDVMLEDTFEKLAILSQMQFLLS